MTEASCTMYGFEVQQKSVLTKLLCKKAFMPKGHYSQSYYSYNPSFYVRVLLFKYAFFFLPFQKLNGSLNVRKFIVTNFKCTHFMPEKTTYFFTLH